MSLFKNAEEMNWRIEIIDLKNNIDYSRRILKHHVIPYHVQKSLIEFVTHCRHRLRDIKKRVIKYD